MQPKWAVWMVVGLVVLGAGTFSYAAAAGAKAPAKADAPKAPAKPEAPKPAEEPDDGIQGLYEGTLGADKAEAKVLGQGGGAFKVLLTAGAGVKAVNAELNGKLADGKVALAGSAGGTEWTGTIADKKLTVEAKGGAKAALALAVRKSPTLGEKPPAGATVILPFEEGKAPVMDEWANATWVANPDGSMNKGRGDNKTKKSFGDMRLHLEFQCPYMPAARGQGRGNSGVYLMDRYEVQVLDSFGLEPKDNEVGGIYKVAVPKVNACLPPGQWQTYDMVFTAPKFDASGKKVKPATVTVMLNGLKIHDNVEIPGPTGGAASKEEAKEAPLRLQDHGNTVKFRNIWVAAPK